jgi:GH15 family glucan-1,4-alpha-glucosidase
VRHGVGINVDQVRVGRRADVVQRSRSACGPPGLYAEEYDVHQHQLRGNLPQAFVHALVMQTAAILATD